MNLEPPKCNVNKNMCDGVSNFGPGMMLGQNSWVFIVISTVTPSVRKGQGCLKIVCKSIFQIVVLLGNFENVHFLRLHRVYCITRSL